MKGNQAGKKQRRITQYHSMPGSLDSGQAEGSNRQKLTVSASGGNDFCVIFSS
jgi:hypothetical protein